MSKQSTGKIKNNQLYEQAVYGKKSKTISYMRNQSIGKIKNKKSRKGEKRKEKKRNMQQKCIERKKMGKVKEG